MLPVDSPKWSELECDLGSAQQVADRLKKAYKVVEFAEGDQAKIDEGVEIASRQISHLYHQQSTYSGTAAAIPHLVHFAKLANLQEKTYMLVMIACMDYENAYGYTPEGLEGAYSNAIHEARSMAIQLLKYKPLTKEQQDNLFETVALIDQTCLHTIRHQGYGVSACTGCSAELMVELSDKGFEVSHEDGAPVCVEPTQDLAAEFEKPRHSKLARFYRLAVAGGHEAFLKWLTQYLGSFTCPACKTVQQIDYKNQ